MPADLYNDEEIIIDALEALWHRAPERRPAIEQALVRRGYDLIHGEWKPRSEIRHLLAVEAEEAEASR